MSNFKHMSTLEGMNEKLKRYVNDDLTDEQMSRSLVRFLIYLTNTKPDIAQAITST